MAPGAFKECLGASDAAEAIAGGVRSVFPDAEIVLVPVADGGTGTVSAIVSAAGGRLLTSAVTGPLGESVEATFGLIDDGRTAVIEMAAASGLELVPACRRDPIAATTFGTGELIGRALEEGAATILVGAGNSATVDAGAGMAQALGAGLLDSGGRQIPRGGGGLVFLDRLDLSGLDARLPRTEFIAACDVDNPLTGEDGAARVYAPQKGATDDMVAELERNLERFDMVAGRDLGKEVGALPGAGAAGGLGAGLAAFMDARLERGAEIVLEYCGLREKISGADLVITAEGKLDGQTAFGKAPVAVARLARECGVRAVAFAGSLGEGAEAVHGEGIDAYFHIAPRPVSLEEALREAPDFLRRAAEQAMRLFKAASNFS